MKILEIAVEVVTTGRPRMLPLDDAVVIQHSVGCQHDGILLPGDLS